MGDDRIEIRALLVRCIVGINPDEREKRQNVVLNLALFCDVRRAGASDDIEDAVNYKNVTKRVVHFVEESQFFLVEKLSTEVARLILTEFPISAVQVRVEKPGALRFARSVGVKITRTRADFDLPPLS